MEQIRREEQTEHLRQQVNTLKNALQYIDHCVDQAAGKYLTRTGPHVHLRFDTFLDLLALEMRRAVRLELANEEKKLILKKTILRDEILNRIEQKVTEMLPVLRAKVSDFVTIRVLIEKRDDADTRRWGNHSMYKAVPVRGMTKKGLGMGPEGAYQNLRERLAVDLSGRTREELREYLSVEHDYALVMFEKARVWKTDAIEDFKIEVRIADE